MSHRKGLEKRRGNGKSNNKGGIARVQRGGGHEQTGPKRFLSNPRFRGLSDNLRTRRFMERQQKAIHRELERKGCQTLEDVNRCTQAIVAAGGPALDLPENATPLERAQDIAWRAWDTPDRKKRIRMAEEALGISKDCADAYVILGNEAIEDAETDKALELFKKGVAAGKRAFGKEMFKENSGNFWGILETRPYLRALIGLANALYATGKKDEAIEQYQEILRLNTDDNQGVRYLLMDLLLANGMDEEARRLLKSHETEWSTDWTYSRVLLEYREHGDGPEARGALLEALNTNPHVPIFLLDWKGIPGKHPDCYETGSIEEAACYVSGARKAWEKDPGALDWLVRSISGVVMTKGTVPGPERGARRR